MAQAITGAEAIIELHRLDCESVVNNDGGGLEGEKPKVAKPQVWKSHNCTHDAA